ARGPEAGSVLPWASDVRHLLGQAPPRLCADFAAAKRLGGYVQARVHEGTYGEAWRHSPAIRRGGFLVSRARMRWLPGHFHDGYLRESGMGPLSDGARHHRQLPHRLYRFEGHDRYARPGDSAVWHDALASGAVLQLHARSCA